MLLECTYCHATYDQKETFGEDTTAQLLAELICPKCGEYVDVQKENTLTTIELIEKLCGDLPKSEWSTIWPLAVEWNKNHYQIPEDVLKKVNDTLLQVNATYV